MSTDTYNVVNGWPDDQRVIASIGDAGQLVVTRMGTPSFLDHIEKTRSYEETWLGPGTPKRSRFTPRPTVNNIADPDLCALATEAACTLSDSVSVAWFNHPKAVRASRRDLVAKLLQGIPGLVVPKTIRLTAPSRRQILEAVASDKLQYPVIVRVAGEHNGISVALLANPADIDRLDTIPWGGQPIYITEYVECRSPDGLYRKHRVMMVGGQPWLRHVALSLRWPTVDRNRLLTDEGLAEERSLIDRYRTSVEAGVEGRLSEIGRRLGLDYFGLDFWLREDGAMVLFEANANMQATLNTRPNFVVWDRLIGDIRQAVSNLLDHPERWVSASGVRVAA